MCKAISTSRIDDIRRVARHIVRELGFMQKGLAGTDLSPSAVHTILELGYGTINKAHSLATLLHLEKSSVSRLLKKLEQEGYIANKPDISDQRVRTLSLTEKGKSLLQQIEEYARGQLRHALDPLPSQQVSQIETGLHAFAKALNQDGNHPPVSIGDITICEGYRAGLIAEVTGGHANYYYENYGFGAIFERQVSAGMSEFIGRIENPINTTFSAYSDKTFLGSVSLDGEKLGNQCCQLRWFIVDPQARGMGLGNLLLKKACDFIDQHKFKQTHLWTFKGLDTAKHLYEKYGFELAHESPGNQWGREVIEQEYIRPGQ